ncbi:uncharacterized protein LOC121298728 isoform X2 [Polyodon spathula]|uniref:uncharacterized protein LOC121298728 isoform X2 n=1 Tax=Polyodon spathula TaxID=7913 RepID=UPI001B7DB553|nr:uncharacterized protein LOC121298728 isoform X2 [Polyodon spathula]
MNPFSAVVIAGIFFGNAYSLSCNSCSGTNSCTPIAVRCSSSPSVCLTVSTSAIGFEQFGFGTSKFTNMCGPKLQYCNETLSADFSELSITVNVECCDSDNCNTGVYTVPPVCQNWYSAVRFSRDCPVQRKARSMLHNQRDSDTG